MRFGPIMRHIIRARLADARVNLCVLEKCKMEVFREDPILAQRYILVLAVLLFAPGMSGTHFSTECLHLVATIPRRDRFFASVLNSGEGLGQ